MPPAKMRGDGRMAKNPKKTLLRLLSYLKHYTPTLIIVLLCVFATAFAQITGSTALGNLVDEFILPMVAEGSADFAPLTQFIFKIACVFIVGVLASFFQSYLMVGVTQGIQKKVRDEMFRKMQSLPLRYFDSNTAGNIMSRYTTLQRCLFQNPERRTDRGRMRRIPSGGGEMSASERRRGFGNPDSRQISGRTHQDAAGYGRRADHDGRPQAHHLQN